jgi:hypothetical protein
VDLTNVSRDEKIAVAEPESAKSRRTPAIIPGSAFTAG